MNLAAVCEHFGFDPENLVETLTASFVPFLEQGVENGVISADAQTNSTSAIYSTPPPIWSLPLTGDPT